MNKLLKKLKKKLAKVNKELQKMPDGRLKRRGMFYYHIIGEKEIGITKNPRLIRKLCRKKHLLSLKKQLENNIPVISRHLGKLDETTEKEMVSALSNTYQGLPISYFLYSSAIDDWLAEPFEKNPFQLKKGEGYATETGIVFRSKSEYIIATILDSYNIPYRYEAAITLGNKTEYPDFIIMNPFTETLIIWEHFGAIHLPEYVEKMNDKMNRYMKNGYIPFKNLICTFEPDINEISRLHVLIENIILKP